MKMKKFNLLAIPVIAAALFTGCTVREANAAPELTGIRDKSYLVNTTVDLLDGVAALDDEDGDITPKLKIAVTPEVMITDGYATFTETGEYEVVYSVADSIGNRAQTTSYVTIVERDVYRSDMLTNEFSVSAGGGARIEKAGLSGDVYSFTASGGEIAEDIRLTRTYALTNGVEYNFKYHFTSNRVGVVKVAAANEEIAELKVVEGSNELSFNHKLPAAGSEEDSETVKIELWLGNLGDVEVTLTRVETSRPQSEIFYERLEDLKLDGKVDASFAEGVSGETGFDNEAGTCYMQVTDPSSEPARYKANLFINTGVAVNAGTDYSVSFDVESENGTPVDVCFNRTRGKEKSLGAVYGQTGNIQHSFTADDFNTGTLWIQVQAGDGVNKITVSNISVKSKETAWREYRFYSFGTFQDSGGDGYVTTEYGTITYNANAFGADDWNNNEMSSPQFSLLGSAKNYVISFKASATSPVRCVILGHDEVADDWITFVWREIYITEEQTTFEIQCDDKDLGGKYKFYWQFGNADNAKYKDVKVEISDLKICLNGNLDG